MSTFFDFRVPSKWYRRVIGGSEVLCGVLLAGFPNRELKFVALKRKFLTLKNYFADKVKNTANVTLLSLMFLAIYSQYVVSDPFERIGPTMVFSFMLIGRLVIYYQVSKFRFNFQLQSQLNFPFCKKDFPSK